MIIATGNVNSIRARQQRVLTWLQSQQPDVLCIQELKITEKEFPFEHLQEAGYHAALYGQKTYNGVAILARSKPQNVERGFNDDVEDVQARFIAATVDDVRILSVDAPSGEKMGSEKYAYKLNWFYRSTSGVPGVRRRAWIDQPSRRTIGVGAKCSGTGTPRGR